MIDTARFKETASAYDLPLPSHDASLTEVDRGTPMGEMLRRYWHVVYKSEKLTDLPVKIRALGEDLVLFRKTTGEAGLVYPRCVHRGTDLVYGKVTEKGIRCCYHGWTFDTDGRCISQPCEPNDGGKGKNAVRQPWYPVAERYGFIFAYLGPLDRKPPLPRYDLLENIPDGWEIIADDNSIPSGGAGYLPCNWLQHHENGIDPAHVPIVHEHQFPPMMAKADVENEFKSLDDRIYGHGIFKLDGMMMDFQVEIVIPNVRIIPSPMLPVPRPDGKSDQISWTLPKDNTDTIIFTAIVQPKDMEPMGDFELYNGKAWRDLTDEEHQRFPGDFEAQVGQGPITLHSEEHLVSSDKGIVLLRRQLQAAVKTVAGGGNPPLTFGPDEIYIETVAGFKMMENPDYVAPPEEEAAPVVAAVSGVDGRWNLTMVTPMGDQKVTLMCTADGNSLTGVMSGDEGNVEITKGSVSGNRLMWENKISKPISMTLKYDVTVDGDRLEGTFKPGMFPKGKVTGTRG